MQLDDYLKSKVRYHLGFNAGAQIPAGDRARLEEAMSLVPDELWYNEIVYHIKRCDIAWKASAAIPDDYFDSIFKYNINSLYFLHLYAFSRKSIKI